MTELILIALSFGLVSNLHCLGMCGPIALALPLDHSSNLSKVKGIAFYSLGRSIGYSVLGVIVGLIGLSADLLGILKWLSIISGILIIIFAWRGYFNVGIGNNYFSRLIQGFMRRFLKNKSKKGNSSLLSFGFVNAFLPCGVVYAALITAMNFGSVWGAVVFMFVFGIGTSPGFFAIAVLKIFKSPFMGKKVIIASLVSIVGLALIVRGMNLDIPYISPKQEITVNEETNKEEASFSCCSKNSDEDSQSNCE
jgi:sulfite exporter TauE/SafE